MCIYIYITGYRRVTPDPPDENIVPSAPWTPRSLTTATCHQGGPGRPHIRGAATAPCLDSFGCTTSSGHEMLHQSQRTSMQDSPCVSHRHAYANKPRAAMVFSARACAVAALAALLVANPAAAFTKYSTPRRDPPPLHTVSLACCLASLSLLSLLQSRIARLPVLCWHQPAHVDPVQTKHSLRSPLHHRCVCKLPQLPQPIPMCHRLVQQGGVKHLC